MPILPIPELSQWSSTAARYRNDCGPDCVAMVLSYYNKLGTLTVDQLSQETALRFGDAGLVTSALVALGDKHGLSMRVNTGTTLDEIRAEIDAMHPVIALIAYRYITGRMDQADNVPGNDGHYILLLGYDDTHIVANDPDYAPAYIERGHDVLIPISQLERALAGNNYHSQCIFMENVPVLDEITAHAKAIEELVSKLQTEPPPPPPAPEPIPDGSELLTVTAAVNCRTQPNAGASKLNEGFSVGEDVVVSKTVTPGGAYVIGGKTYTDWLAVTARKGKGGYIAARFTNRPT